MSGGSLCNCMVYYSDKTFLLDCLYKFELFFPCLRISLDDVGSWFFGFTYDVLSVKLF